MTSIRFKSLFDQCHPLLLLPQLFTFVPRSVMEKVLDECGAREQRYRKLPALLVMILCIVRHWFSHESLDYVQQKLVGLPALSVGVLPRLWSADKSSISEARYRLGAKPLECLFKQVCHPQTTPATPGSFRFGKRLVALDGTVETVADSLSNAAYFGRSTNSYGDSAYPQLRCLYLVECGSPIIFDAGIWPYCASEKVYLRRLLRSLSDETLVMMDMGLSSVETLLGVRAHGADFLARVEKRWRLDPLSHLADGSFLAEMVWEDAPAGQPNHLPVRVVVYTLDDPQRPGHGERHRLITSLLDPQLAPALDLVCTYHERWEIEVTIDELDTHQRLSQQPFRSQRPVGVIQEVYALLIAHFVIRCWMLHAAQSVALDPDRLSFIQALRVVRDSLPLPYFHFPLGFHPVLCDTVAFWQIPPRDNRINPRLVKRRLSKFPRKHFADRHPPQPSLPFPLTVRLC
ncbi:MAG: IS4 family transposase [Anaerolineae bacterium]|nr:IS4 family transposase [Anaerolineae bacterium]